MQAKKRNMERMVEVVPDSNWQATQHFASHSPWSDRALTNQIAKDANSCIGGDQDSCLLLDESALTKKGAHSVGVARQWNGRLGKVDNCQVGVFAALCRRKRVTLIDTRLFLPECWTTNKARCKQAGVPTDRLKYRKKTELAVEMVHNARKNGISFQWVGGDGFYGEDPGFLRQLDKAGEVFMMDIHQDQHIYLEDPQPYIPKRKGKKGPHPKRFTTALKSVEARFWVAEQPKSAWKKQFVRSTTQEDLIAQVLHREVWLWDGKEPRAHKWHLIVTLTPSSRGKLKFSLSNAPSDTPLSRLVFMQAQRYWIERAFEDAKSEAGMNEYQVRGWRAWHHHMAMVMLAQLFMLETRLKFKDDHPLLSCYDIRDMLSHFLPRRDVTPEEVLRQMLVRHQQRAESIRYHKEKQALNQSD